MRILSPNVKVLSPTCRVLSPHTLRPKSYTSKHFFGSSHTHASILEFLVCTSLIFGDFMDDYYFVRGFLGISVFLLGLSENFGVNPKLVRVSILTLRVSILNLFVKQS